MPASPCSDPTSGLATSSSWQSSFLCQSSPCSSVEQQHEVRGAGMLTQLRLGHAPGGPRKPVSHPHSFSLSSALLHVQASTGSLLPSEVQAPHSPLLRDPGPPASKRAPLLRVGHQDRASHCLPQTAHLPGRVSGCVISPLPESSPWGITQPDLVSPFLPNSMWILLSFSLRCTALSTQFSGTLVPHIDVFLMCSWQ